MANDEEVLASTVREYFLKNGGRVKRNDLFDHFRGQLNKFEDEGTSKNRFGDIVNSLASLQNIEGEKYFVLKKARNGTTPVLLRRSMRQVNQRKDKGISLPASMRNFRFSTADDGNLAIGDKVRPRVRTAFRSESYDHGMRRNNSDTSIVDNGQTNDSGIDTAVSSLQSESPRDSRQSSLSRNSEYDQMSQNSGDTGFSFLEDDHYEHDVPSHVLTAFEKSWMMSSMTGNKAEIICQLEEDHSIVKFKDFITGTALHWAVKQGSEELVRLLVEGGADVNSKSGYTPLHLATMHGKVNIINILIDEYHANVHIRDHSGKEPKDVVTKNVSEQTKLKLAEPDTATALAEMAKKFPAMNSASDSSSGFSKYLEPKDSPKIKPKLKGGASFRFLKKQKKLKRSERPVIEHWDSSRQERLESTLENDEKALYKMQRNNSGSLFPISFYAKKPSQAEQPEEKPDTVNGAEELVPNSEDSRQRLSQSFPESEFRNLSRISEGELQESSDERESPSVSLSNPGTVQDGKSMLGGKKANSTSADVFEADRIRRRSQSDNNLTKYSSSQDELTMNQVTNGRPFSVFAENTSRLNPKIPPHDDGLTLKIDSSPKKGSLDPFKGEELATFMILPNKNSGIQQDGKPLSSSQLDGRSIDSSGKLNKVDGNLSNFDEELPEPAYNKDISKFNNNYKQVSEMLTSSEQKNAEITEEPTSPVRPPRKKDKKKYFQVTGDNIEQFVYDFETGKEKTFNSESPTKNHDGVSSAKIADRGKGLDSARDYGLDSSRYYDPPENWRANDGVRSRPNYQGNENLLERKSQSSTALNQFSRQDEQFNTNPDYTKRNPDSKSHDDHFSTRVQPYQDYTRRKSDGFTIHKAYSDENMSNTRRKSDGFIRDDEPRKPNYTEGFTTRTERLRTELESSGFTHQNEDHPRRSSREEILKSGSEFARRKSEGFEQRSESFTDQRRLDGFQKEMSLDHPRRRTMHSLPSKTKQNESRHVLPEVLLDTSRRRASSGYTRGSQDGPPSRDDFRSNRQVDKRVPPPYRPPPGLVKDGSEQGNRRPPTRPNYRPPPPPVTKEPPPYRKSQEFNPAILLTAPAPSSSRPNELSFRSSENLSNTRLNYPSPSDVTPTPPPRKHRTSSSEDTAYPPTELSPTAPLRKHRTSVPLTEDLYHPLNDVSPTAPPRKHRGRLRSEDYPPTELSSTAPPYRPPFSRSAEHLPSYSSPSSPSNVPPPGLLHKSQESVDYTFGREMSLDYPKRSPLNYDGDVSTVKATGSYGPTEDNTHVTNYQRSEPKDYFQSKEDHFEGQSGNYRRSEPNEYNPTEYGNIQSRSRTLRRSEGNEYNRSDSSYPQTSIPQYPSDYDRNFQSEFSSNFQPTAARNQVDGYERWPIHPRSAVDTTTRDQSPPDEVVVAKSVTSEPDNYPKVFQNDRRAPFDYSPIQKPQDISVENIDRRNGTQPSYENEYDTVIKPKYEGYTESNTVLTPKYEGYQEANTVLMPKYKGYTESNTVLTPKYEGYQEANTVLMPKYEGYQEANTVLMPKYEGYQEANTVLMPKYEGYTESNTVLTPKYEGYTESNTVLTPKYEGYQEANTVLMPKYEGYQEANTVLTPKYEGYQEANTVLMPKYEGYTESNTVLTPKYEGYTETGTVLMPKYEGSHISRPEMNVSRPEHNFIEPQYNFVEPEFIVAKQMSAHEVVNDPMVQGSTEDMNTHPGVLGQDMKNKWVSNSSDGSNESSENRSKYRMTSMI